MGAMRAAAARMASIDTRLAVAVVTPLSLYSSFPRSLGPLFPWSLLLVGKRVDGIFAGGHPGGIESAADGPHKGDGRAAAQPQNSDFEVLRGEEMEEQCAHSIGAHNAHHHSGYGQHRALAQHHAHDGQLGSAHGLEDA